MGMQRLRLASPPAQRLASSADFVELSRSRNSPREPERQRGLWSFLTWPFILAPIAAAEAFVPQHGHTNLTDEQDDSSVLQSHATPPAWHVERGRVPHWRRYRQSPEPQSGRRARQRRSCLVFGHLCPILQSSPAPPAPDVVPTDRLPYCRSGRWPMALPHSGGQRVPTCDTFFRSVT